MSPAEFSTLEKPDQPQRRFRRGSSLGRLALWKSRTNRNMAVLLPVFAFV